MKLGTKLLFAAPIVLLIMTVEKPAAKAWDYGGYNGCDLGSCEGYHHYWDNGCGWSSCGNGGGQGLFEGDWYHQGSYQNGYSAGISDTIYDHQNNLVYSDQPSCLSCHSQSYLDGFRSGYDQQYNSYQNQESTQGSSINIYGQGPQEGGYEP